MRRMVQVLSGPLEGQSYEVPDGKEIVLGRGLKNEAVLSHDPCLSTRHALVRCVKGQWEVCDLNSSNGTFVDGRKIKPDRFHPVSDFFVLGSTVLNVLETAEPSQHEPVLMNSRELERFRARDVYAKACETAAEASHPFVNTTHLFIALMDLHLKSLQGFFRRTELEPGEILERWQLTQVFDIPYRWINDFLRFQNKQRNRAGLLVTPRVQAIMDLMEQLGSFEPQNYLESLLMGDFNLVFPLLDWRKTEKKWFHEGNDQVGTRKEAPLTLHQSLILPDGIWGDLKRAMGKRRPLIMVGSKGCGKTAIMHRVFHPMSDVTVCDDIQDKPKLFDSSVFLVFNSPTQIKPFVETIQKALTKPGLVGLDHFGHLLETMQEEYVDRGPLIKAIRTHHAHVILAVQEENQSMIQRLIPEAEWFNLDQYVNEVRDQIVEHFLVNFERRVQCLIGPEARSFFYEHIVKPAPINLVAMRDYLNLCLNKSHNIDFPFKELSEETRVVGMLGRRFFRDAFDEWMGRTKATSQHAVPQESEKARDLHMELLLQLETLVQAFVKNEFKVSLHYSDQTRSLTEQRFLTVEQKIEELKSHMVVLLTSYQASFRRWFDDFWQRISPESLKMVDGVGSSPKKLWNEFVARSGVIDTAYAEDHFHEIAARVFVEVWRSQKRM